MSCLDSDQGFCFINLDRKYTVLIFLDAKAPAEAQFSITKSQNQSSLLLVNDFGRS
jgi:hypothetical protein